MMISKAKLMAGMPSLKGDRADAWLDSLNEGMYAYTINSPARAAAFLATVAVESGELAKVRENTSYTSAMRLRVVFPKVFATDEDAQPYVGKPRETANLIYANRMGNGPPATGDGWKYRGGGLIELTGKDMYREYGADKGIAAVEHPELLELPVYAADSAAWFFVQHTKSILVACDALNFREVTHLVNGGYNEWVDRKKYYDRFTGLLA